MFTITNTIFLNFSRKCKNLTVTVLMFVFTLFEALVVEWNLQLILNNIITDNNEKNPDQGNLGKIQSV